MPPRRSVAAPVLALAFAATCGGACLLIDDLRIESGSGSGGGGSEAATHSTSASGGGKTTNTVSATAQSASGTSGATTTTATASSSTGCALPLGNENACKGGMHDGTCDLDEACTCIDCWNDETLCPASMCNGDGSCQPLVETCTCCDCADQPDCNP